MRTALLAVAVVLLTATAVAAQAGLTVTTAEPAGPNCELGGTKTASGLDNGDGGGVAADGTLQSGEVDTIAYACKSSGAGDFAGLGLDGFLFVLFWISAALFFLYRDWAFSLAFTIPGLLDALFPEDIPGEFAQYLLFAFLGVLMQYFVGDRQRFSLHGKKKVGA